MENDFYRYIGNLELDINPLVNYLKESVIPLFEDKTYKEQISLIGNAQQFKPIWLDKKWEPTGSDLFKRYVVPFYYGDTVNLFVLGGMELLNMFPEIFQFPKKYKWYEQLKSFEVRPQLVISDSSTSIHRDYDRSCAFNTFLYNTDCSITEFYDSTYSTKLSEISYNIGDTYLLNVNRPHRVKHIKPALRIALSWGYKCSFKDAVNFIENT